MENLIPKSKNKNLVSNVPLQAFNSLVWMGASKTKLTLLTTGDYKIHQAPAPALVIFIFFLIIFWIKTLHLAGLLVGVSGIDISEFYDKIAVLTWFLILTGCGVGYWGLVGSYPFYEILKEGFRIQNRIFLLFQQTDAENIQWKVTYAGKWVIARQIEIIVVCLISISVQFDSFPKYITNIYVMLPWENDFLFWTMYTFEFLCMFLIVILWDCALSGLPMLAIYLEQTLRLMSSKILQSPISRIDSSSLRRPPSGSSANYDRRNDFRITNNRPKSKDKSSNALSRLGRGSASESNSQYRSRIFETDDGNLKELEKYEYSIPLALRHYRELLIYADRLNDFHNFKVLTIHALLFGQQTAEAFTAFRMLKIPGIALSDFAFLLTDMWTAVRQLFLNFKGISFVGEAAEEFLHGLRLRINNLGTTERKYYRRILKSLKPIYIKQGPNKCHRDLLGCAWMIMMNYYVTAALWP